MRVVDQIIWLSASDSADFLACRHLTRLDLLRASDPLKPPKPFDFGFEDLVGRGEIHEASVLDRLQAQGLKVIEIEAGSVRAGAVATREALAAGAQAIYQGVLMQGDTSPALLGRPDFIVRADLLPSPDGEPRQTDMGHEVIDAKLARSAKARAVLQTAFYTYLLASVQATEPRWMHLALGNGELASFRVKDFAAFERQVRRLLEGPSLRTLVRTHRPTRIPIRSNTARYAGGARCAALDGGSTMTCRSSRA
ncbi:MAG: hypothetical protein LC721_08755 [Actinobacteria bacterium]|nr:hypothetical protein [Actinomycetota bacterium]